MIAEKRNLQERGRQQESEQEGWAPATPHSHQLPTATRPGEQLQKCDLMLRMLGPIPQTLLRMSSVKGWMEM